MTFPVVFDLVTLDGTNGFALQGAGSSHAAGWSVSDAGDVNGDGYADVIVGAPAANGTGSSYVVFGKSGGWDAEIDLGSLDGTDGFILSGVDSNDKSGWSVASAGDVNGDGFDDLLVGAWSSDVGSKKDAGESYLVFGAATGWNANFYLSSLNGTNGVLFQGLGALDNSGWSVSSAGDINGDGFDDIIIGALGADALGRSGSGESYVIFGTNAGWSSSFDLDGLDGTNGFVVQGAAAGERSGISVSSAGDVNGDGYDDFIVGSYLADPNGITNAGRAYVVYGKGTAWTAVFDLDDLDGTNGFSLTGEAGGDYAGISVSTAGDINGDGYDDIIVGAYGAATLTGSDAGMSYVVFGMAGGMPGNLNLSALSGSNGFKIEGIDDNDASGFSVSHAGDVNGDGFDDILVGANRGDNDLEQDAGEAYIIYGRASGWSGTIYLNSLDGTNGFVLRGVDTIDYAGRSVSAAGDVNGDGMDDFMIGAYGTDQDPIISNSGAGETYIIFGRLPTTAVVRYGSEIGQTIYGGNLGDRLFGLGGDDILKGMDDDDFLDGGTGDDNLDGGAGNDRIIYDAADTAANVTGGADIDTLVVIGGTVPLSYNLAAGLFEFAEHQRSDSGSEFWTTITDTYNAAWQQTAQDGVADDLRVWHTDYDVANTQWYSDVTNWYQNDGGPLQYTNYTHDNGTTVNQALDFDSSQWWQYFTNYFDVSMNLTNTDGVADDLRYWSASNDVSGTQWWSSYTLWYDTQDPGTRQLINEEGVADDGRTWTTTYDVDDMYAWTSQTNWFDSNGDLIETVTV